MRDCKFDTAYATARAIADGMAKEAGCKHQPTRDEVIERGEYLGAVEYESGATEQRWSLDDIVFAEICDAGGHRVSWKCLGKTSQRRK